MPPGDTRILYSWICASPRSFCGVEISGADGLCACARSGEKNRYSGAEFAVARWTFARLQGRLNLAVSTTSAVGLELLRYLDHVEYSAWSEC